MLSKIKMVVVGAGNRGFAYARYAQSCPEEAEVVAVCEPRAEWRDKFAAEHRLLPERCFADWRELLQQPKLADAALICTGADISLESHQIVFAAERSRRNGGQAVELEPVS